MTIDLAYFYRDVEYQDLETEEVRDEEGVVTIPATFTLRIESELVSKPECRPLADLKRILSLGKPQKVIDKFIQLAINHDQWSWFEALRNWEEDVLKIEAFNANLPVIKIDEEGDEVLAEPLPLPAEPFRPKLVDVVEFKAINSSLFTASSKREGADILGHTISLNESNQNGLAAVMTGVQLATTAGIEMFPLTFKAETATGDTSVTFTDINSYTEFALTFMAARQKFFK